MAKDKITDYDSNASLNTDVGGVNLAENSMNPSDVNNAIREVLSHQKEAFGSGTPLFVDQTNNRVGIGVTSPATPFHVQTSTDGTGVSGDDLYVARFQNQEATTDKSFGVDIQAGSSTTDQALRIKDHDGTNSLMLVDGLGNMAIGQTDVRAKLSIGKAKSGTSAESVNLLSLEPTGTFAIGDKANISFNRGSTTQAQISGYYGDDNVAYGELVFSTRRFTTDALNEGFRLDNRGHLLIGKTGTDFANAGFEFRSGSYMSSTNSGGQAAVFNRLSDFGDIVQFHQATTQHGSIAITSPNDLQIIGSADHVGLQFAARSFIPLLRNTNNAAVSQSDNAIDIGTAGARFDDIHATNGTIQTSDRNEKQDIEELNDAEKRVAVVAKGLMRKFRWKDKVAEKGDKARTHFGIIAQDLEDAFKAEGLDASKYAMFCSDTWWEKEISVDAVEAKDAVYEEKTDDDGNKYNMLKSEAVEAKDGYTYIDIKQEATTGYTEKTRLGVRYPELLAFIISAI